MRIKQIQTRCKKRSSIRGAAFVEALVVLPFFIIIFASMVLIGRLYETKMQAMRLSKERAWTAAMTTCSGSDTSQGSEGGSELDGHMDTNGVQDDAQDMTQEMTSKRYGSVTSTVSLHMQGEHLIGVSSKTLTSTTKVMCNEVPQNGDIVGVIRYFIGVLTRW